LQRQHAAAWDEMLASLEYGAIAVNTPGLISFATTSLGWGGFPGSSPQARAPPAWLNLLIRCRSCTESAPTVMQDIGSGNCFVHNTGLYDHVQKSVLHAPFRFHPRPPFWSPSHHNLEAVGRAALRFTAYPSIANMLPLAQQALKG
jgi:hypothetical protein